jgi:plasmid stability protein
MSQMLTLHLPEILYARLQERARQANRSVEAELLEVLAVSVPAANNLPQDLTEALAGLALLDDEALWQAGRSRLPEAMAAQLEALHLKRQREGLTQAETQTSADLLRQYERAMVIRAQAALLLHERGRDVASLLKARSNRAVPWPSMIMNCPFLPRL